MSEARQTALVVHGTAEILDLLTRWFEASGMEVVSAVTAYRAQAALEGDKRIDVVIAPWDHSHPVGGEIYRWVLQHRHDLRNRFVFVADEVPPEFDSVVGGRCLAVPLSAVDELTRVALAIVRRVRTPALGVPVVRERDRPTLLIVDDDPMLLETMASLLYDEGYAVTSMDSGNSAIEVLEVREFDTIVSDWHMHDGSGADLYRWILRQKPHLAARVVFLAEAAEDDTGPVAPGRPMFRKGQDSTALTKVLREIVAAIRG
ncbi:MAG TPA: response regulator [Kofleriaceae bacterium]